MSSQNNNGATTDHAFGMRQFLGSLRTLLSWITWILPFIFVFVKFNVPELINNSDPSLIMQFTIASWYLSWVFGLNIDIQMQESVYMYDPHQGEVPKFIYIILWRF